LRGAASRGADTKTLVLSGLDIHPCRHCDSCFKDGRCIIKDDMPMVYDELAAADRIVLASPVQFMGPSAELKTMIDRGQAFWARKYILKLPALLPEKERSGFYISAGGRTAAKLFEPSLAIIKSYFFVLSIKYAGDILVPGIDARGDILKRPDVLKQAFAAGAELTA
jgi:multimeric flavodoxin WrbA